MIRVLVVEDSPTVRAMIVAVLQSDPDISVVGQAVNGEEALKMVAELKPGLVTMDLHMPVMDGLAATRAIMTDHPTPIVLMTGSSVKEDVALSFEALRAGALAIADKPKPGAEPLAAQWARFVETVKALADVRVVRLRPGFQSTKGDVEAPRRVTARAIGIGASAGGPKALRELILALPVSVSLPLLVVQHMSPGFSGGFADWLRNEVGKFRTISVAAHGASMRDNTVYLPPDGMHLGLGPDGTLLLSDAPPVSGFRPSATFLFESMAQVLGQAAIGVILTGMGTDGAEGLKDISAAGGLVIAQDAESSLVYGMPGAAEAAGVVEAFLPPARIGPYIAAAISGERWTGPRARAATA